MSVPETYARRSHLPLWGPHRLVFGDIGASIAVIDKDGRAMLRAKLMIKNIYVLYDVT
jgi:hypothetical protein